MLKLTHDDPRLTAYVLGELSDEEAQQVEAALAADVALQAECDALRAVAHDVRTLLAADPLPDVSPAVQQAVLHTSAAEPHVISLAERRAARIPRGVWGSFAIAATVALGLWAPSIWRSAAVNSTTVASLPPVLPSPTMVTGPAGTSAPPSVEPFSRDLNNEVGLVASAPAAIRRGAKQTPDSALSEAFATVEAMDAAALNTERYLASTENRFESVAQRPLSTFGIDVDTASYSNVRRFLLQQQTLPPRDSVRLEELINYFSYDAAPPQDGKPFAVQTELAAAPWAPQHQVLRVTLKGKEITARARPDANLVFLIDVSGSMDEPNKLPLVQWSLKLLTKQLSARDRIAIVTYAGSSGVVLPSTAGNRTVQIDAAIDQLGAGGSTNGAAGIIDAYQLARAHMVPGGINRVILATDGDFNVGVTGEGELARMAAAQAKTGVQLSVLGFGMGNYNDAMLEQIADKGDGNYAYIDSIAEARKVLVEQAGGTLVTIAKDVKLQVEFNPRAVAGYRLLGYENRALRDEDFRDDTKDSGDLGAGHTVTALYEIIPAGMAVPTGAVDALKYQKPVQDAGAGVAVPAELATVSLRYKQPDATASQQMAVPVSSAVNAAPSAAFRLATGVAEFGMLLTQSEWKGASSYDHVVQQLRAVTGDDPQGQRVELLNMVQQARILSVR